MARWLVPIEFKAVVHIVDDGDTEAQAVAKAKKQFVDRYTGPGEFAEGKYVADTACAGKPRRTNDG